MIVSAASSGFTAAVVNRPTMSTSRRHVLSLSAGVVLAPLFVRHARASDTPRFALGIASGHPKPDRLVLWTRLSGADLPASVDVRWELAHDEAFTKIAASGTEQAEAIWAHSVHAEPQGLQPARWYWYRFTALGQQSAVGRTRTAPAADAEVNTLRFAIASCQRWDHGHYAAWRHLATQDLDLVLFLGDYIYEYASPPLALRYHAGTATLTLDDYRNRYAQYKGDPALQAAHAAAPWLVVWDDHEIENDYADGRPQGGPDPLFASRRAAATQAYWEHMPFPKAMRPRGSEMRLYERYDWGTLARIHTLDDRQYRDVQACPRPGRNGSNTVKLKDCPELLDPKRSLLGADQERWLAQGWDSARGWNLLAQQTLMSRFAWSDPAEGGTYWTDGWDGYAASRSRLLGAVTERKLPGVVVLGGDVHANYVADLKADYDDAKSPVIATEFCGTSISSNGLAQSRVDAARPFNPHVRYSRTDQRGYVGFALGAKRLDASLWTVQDPKDDASPVNIATRFAVELGRPGAQPA
ncbi:MAG: alkaline phosphatase D family protein [Rhizobacter sp.]|nr:alkaline phosphatase D family protein [Rhizobacter sp.]